MIQGSVFKPWVPNWLVILVLVFCMLHSMVLLGVYTSNITYSASFLDVEVEDLQFSLCVTYGTFLATIMIESRLFKYFPTKKYFVTIYGLAAITFMLSAYTDNFSLFIVLRMVEGVLMALPWIPLRQLLITRFQSKNAVILGFTFNYGTLLLASPFIMNIAVWLLENYDWKYMAYGSAMFQIICVGLVMLTFNENRFHKKIPLYQVDWSSYILVLTAILSGAFVFIYGEKLYWFDSIAIKTAIVVAFITGGLFVMRQMALKRPCFDMGVFQFYNLRVGFLLFIIFYISRATLNICHSTMFSVWNWEPTRVAHVQYLNVIGNLIGMITAGFILAKGLASRYAFILGFFLLAVYHLWFTFLFVPDAALIDVVLPYIIQGIAVGVLFVPLVLFTVSSVPVEYAPFSGTVGVSGRFWGSTIGFCIMQNTQVFLQNKHYTKLRQSVLWESPETQERISQYTNGFIAKGYAIDDAGKLAIKQVLGSLSKQSVLLGNMEIFTTLGYVLLFLAVLLLFNKHLKQTFDIFKNRVWGS